MGFKSDGIRWTWSDSYTTTTTTGDPIEIKAPEWKIGDKIEINSPITDSSHTAAAPSKNAMGVEPINYGWVCPCCGRVNAPWVGWCSCSGKRSDTFVKINTTPAFSASPCRDCTVNPANGGSGNCNCILGTPQVMC